MSATSFFAYPGEPPLIGEAVRSATDLLKATRSMAVTPWTKMNILGLKLDDLIRSQIDSADFLAADITYPNFNVYYEIGFAVGRGKPIVPTVNRAVAKGSENVQLTGLFDTTGYLAYENAQELARFLGDWNNNAWTNSYRKPKDHTQPLFILDTSSKTDFRNYIIQAVSNSLVEARSFDPAEVPRLSMMHAVGDVSASAGVILPLISQDIVDATRHNLRAAFLAGLSHGYGIEPLIIQYDDKPAPLDYRDNIDTTRTRHEVERAVSAYCQQTLIKNQQRSETSRRPDAGILDRIDIGSSAAENEFQKLGKYFIRTAEYSRALRIDRAVVAGRKGSGKSAIFFQAAEEYARDARNVVLELRPASHNLSELREALLGVENVGVFAHTIAAFWQYIIYSELMLKLRERLLPRAKNNFTLLNRIRELEERFQLSNEIVAGDFTSRLEAAIREVIRKLKELDGKSDVRAKLTNIMFEGQIAELRNAIAELAAEYSSIVLLFDNIDKGWPARQVEKHDVATVLHLVDILNKIQRELRRQDIEFRYLLFLRSDVYENLVAQTSDRGKFNIIKVDWTDPAQLEHLVRERVYADLDAKEQISAWSAINPVLHDGETAMHRMISNSLRRPRFLIDLVERTLSFSINRGHAVVQSEDVEDALKQMSLYLVSDFGYEIRDVSGVTEDLFYHFLGHAERLTAAELSAILNPCTGNMELEALINLLLWFGFLGISSSKSSTIFIYDREYDFRRLTAERGMLGDDLVYVVNPAFLRGLQ